MSFKEPKVMTPEERDDYNSKRRERYKNDPRYRARELDRAIKYQHDNKDKLSEKRREYYKKNKELCNARTKDWMRRNRKYWINYVVEYQKRKKDEKRRG